MFRTLCLCFLATAPAAVHAQNLLVNGDLELPGGAPDPSDLIVGWTLDEPTVGPGGPINSATFAAFGNHTPGGSRGLWLRSFEGGSGSNPTFVSASLHQTVPALAGTAYTLSAWFKFEAHYTSESTLLSLEFLDPAMQPLSTTSLDINAVNPRDSQWRHFIVPAMADPGAMFVRARVDMLRGTRANMNPQSAFADDFVLIPSPGAAALLSLAGLALGRRRR